MGSNIQESSRSSGNERGKRKKRHRVHLDMTAMVDVAFLLLTFFVLSTSLVKNHVIDMSYPPQCSDCEQGLPVDEEKILTLILDKDEKVFHFEGMAENGIHETNFAHEGVRTLLLKHLKREDPIVVIKPKKEAKYRSLVNVLDELIITGHKKYVIAPFSEVDQLAMETFQAVN